MDALLALTSEPLDAHSKAPLYQQLKNRIKQVIATRALEAGDALPAEEEIARNLGIARGTVRRCFGDLVSEGVVVRERGLGTFVAQARGARVADISLDPADASSHGPGASSQVLGVCRRRPEPRVCQHLGVAEDAEVWEIRQVRSTDGKPLQYETSFVPCSVCPELSTERLGHSLYALVADASGRMPARADEVFEAVNVDAAEAEALGVFMGCATLRVLRTTYDQHGEPYEASVTVLRPGSCRIAATLDASGATLSRIAS